MRDPNPLVSGSGIKKLKDAGIKVDTGVLKKESVKLNEVFIKHIVSGYPFIVLKTAVTVDGKTATETGDSMWITGEKSRKYVHRLRSQYDAVLTGIGTVLKDNPELTVRAYKNKRNPVRIIADSRGRIPPDAKVLRKDAKTIIACTNRIKDSKLKRLKKMNIDVLICREKGNRVYIKDLLKKLSKRGITSILLESGSELNASFLDEGLVDKLLVFIAPKLIGGKNAPGFVSGKGIELMKNAYDFTPFELKRFNNDILLETYFKKNYEKYYL
jgi:diaminohydroxyphosphoribosylaminopyrimidine deaminase / 5-amino-6-(5-phosphoribosylamino)uracil reductase